MKITVTGSEWVNGSGWSYSEFLDPMEVESVEDYKEATIEYTEEFTKGMSLLDETDYQLGFYVPDEEGEPDENYPQYHYWVSEYMPDDDEDNDED